MTLLWLNPATGAWENAVDGDHGNNTHFVLNEYMGSYADFLAANQFTTSTDLSLYLGAFGVDTANNTVWAVIDHNSSFGVGNPLDAPTEIVNTPEPSTYAMLIGGLGMLAFWHRRTRQTR